MDEYHQVTLSEWMDLKEMLEKELHNFKKSFVRVGYVLRRMEDTKAYEAEGYKSIAEFAQKEHGLSPSTTSRWIAINKAFSLDGYSETLDPKYINLNASQLTEMLTMAADDREMVRPGTTIAEIRSIKAVDKEEAGIPEFANAVKMFLEDKEDILKELRALWIFRNPTEEELIEVVNPSGTSQYRKSGTMLMFYEDSIKFKTAGNKPVTLQWSEFFSVAYDAAIKDYKEESEDDGNAVGGAEADDYPDNQGDSGENCGISLEDSNDGRGIDAGSGGDGQEVAGCDANTEGSSGDEPEGAATDEGDAIHAADEGDPDTEQMLEDARSGEPDEDESDESTEAPDDGNEEPEKGSVNAVAISQNIAEIQEKTQVGKVVDEQGNPAPEPSELLTEAQKRDIWRLRNEAKSLCRKLGDAIELANWKEACANASQLHQKVIWLNNHDV